MSGNLIKCVFSVNLCAVQDLRKYGKHFAYIELNRFRIARNGEGVVGGAEVSNINKRVPSHHLLQFLSGSSLALVLCSRSEVTKKSASGLNGFESA